MQEIFWTQSKKSEIKKKQYDIVIARNFKLLFELEPEWSNINGNLFDTPGDIALTNYYIYYIMLTKEERNLFPRLRKFILLHNIKLHDLYQKESMERYYKNELINTSSEEKFIFSIGCYLFNKYDPTLGIISEMEKNVTEKNLNNFVHSVFENNYSRFPDYVLMMIIIGYGIYGQESKILSDRSKEEIDAFLYDIMSTIVEDKNEPTESGKEDTFDQLSEELNMLE